MVVRCVAVCAPPAARRVVAVVASGAAPTASSSPAAGMRGSLPSAPLIAVKAAATSSAAPQYSPSSQRQMRSTRGDVIWLNISSAFATTDGRSCACTSMISRTKSATSTADAWCASARNSIRTGTTVCATSGNLTAHAWIAPISSSLYSAERSAFASSSEPAGAFERETSFLSACTTSPMLRGVIKSRVMSRHFLRMSRFGLESARMMSMTISCITLGCRPLSSCSLSSTMSFTLWSDSADKSCAYDPAAARMAVGEAVSAVSVEEHS
mmetsp:Transcript_17507/g.54418  ORF Transcript_17507/g.54418 Transcript_17507/m.54418 type:complete len:268 (+) Transcript_17507:174-977(+)